jgi:two-component system, LytTR family, sensor kinase
MALSTTPDGRARSWLPALAVWTALLLAYGIVFVLHVHSLRGRISVKSAGQASTPVAVQMPLIISLVYWLIVSAYIAIKSQNAVRDRKRRITELESLLAQSRIETLRTQLNPHFLFNALNTISAHVESAPRTARWMLEQLGDLLRLSLDHAGEQEIPLQQELAFVDRYLKLQKIRYEEKLDVIVDVEPTALRALVPTFILQPLLENAIRYGIAMRPAPGTIEIEAWQEGDTLHLTVRDDGPGLPANWDPECGLGVGLSNTRERLRRLYGDDQSFHVTGAPGAGVQVDLTLPFRRGTLPSAGLKSPGS